MFCGNYVVASGGLWSALTLYAKKLAVGNGTAIPPRPLGPSVIPTKVAAFVARWPKPEPMPNITIDAQGNILIPAAALSFKNKTAAVSSEKSWDGGFQLRSDSGDYDDPSASSFGYQVR